jgi:catechol 2,3-dioxygenase-like lactoylglutathione lyase family enzyme
LPPGSARPETARSVEHPPIDVRRIAFDLGKGEMPEPSPNTPSWVPHLALEVDSADAVMAAKARLESAGVEVRGVVDHEFVQSIYFFDPNGLRVELTTRTEKPGFLQTAAREARSKLVEWQQL